METIYKRILIHWCRLSRPPYIAERGGLDNPNTNQQFYAKGKVLHKMSAYENSFYDVTNKFWKHGN